MIEDPRTDPDNERLLETLKSNKCWCSSRKEEFVSFCRECSLALPFDLRMELWRPWTNGFAEIYQYCIDYLDEETTRLCPKKESTTSSVTSTSSSAKDSKKSSGKRSRKIKALSVFAPEISPASD